MSGFFALKAADCWEMNNHALAKLKNKSIEEWSALYIMVALLHSSHSFFFICFQLHWCRGNENGFSLRFQSFHKKQLFWLIRMLHGDDVVAVVCRKTNFVVFLWNVCIENLCLQEIESYQRSHKFWSAVFCLRVVCLLLVLFHKVAFAKCLLARSCLRVYMRASACVPTCVCVSGCLVVSSWKPLEQVMMIFAACTSWPSVLTLLIQRVMERL